MASIDGSPVMDGSVDSVDRKRDPRVRPSVMDRFRTGEALQKGEC
ncbi:hypothetical protein D3OALGA1CA_4492 [Olavius algarvensis associated proteobacterium Delta 3]|nr:hypothetical protein D3OALGB2SA_2354 [Olavius algarvensis associated proteobacterium Delta 3]CAB5152155.1 hypothetical protein D3OALGA1CA_4492 [Olavius algarvensis associated proteobacterium Delta 3]